MGSGESQLGYVRRVNFDRGPVFSRTVLWGRIRVVLSVSVCVRPNCPNGEMLHPDDVFLVPRLFGSIASPAGAQKAANVILLVSADPRPNALGAGVFRDMLIAWTRTLYLPLAWELMPPRVH